MARMSQQALEVSLISFDRARGVQLRYLRDAAVLVAPEDLAGGFASRRAAANANGLRWRAVDLVWGTGFGFSAGAASVRC
ncbi:hypothetical protein, partial [Mesorhizobium sp.]|uniref:hypothetical protein n=1 Tax=Mesorhizobium sp. TaxID=1871066 RepID=UPI0025C3D472